MLKIVSLLFLFVLTVDCAGTYGGPDAGTSREGLRPHRAPRGAMFDNMFNVYDPSLLSGVWPKLSNGVHLRLESPCWDHMHVLFKDLLQGRAWAYDAVDASGRYQAALFTGSRFWLGSKDECIRLDNNFLQDVDNETLALLRNNANLYSVLRKQKYFDAEINEWRWMIQQDELLDRLVAADHRPPYRMAYSTLQVQLDVTKITMMKSYEIILGVCLPQSCSQVDVESIINFSIMLNDNLKTNKTIPRTAKITSSRKMHGEFHVDSDAGAILLVTVTVFLVAVATIATLVDFDLLKCVRYRKQSMSFDLPTYNNCETKLVDELKRKHNEFKSLDEILAENANLNLVSLKQVPRSLAAPPITLEVVNVDSMSGNCNRCGKYKRQCSNNKQQDNLPACPRVKYSSFASLSTEDSRRKHLFCRLLLCFSISCCWKRIFNKNTANKDLSLIHVMRILATLWIIFVHVAVIVGYTSENAGDINERDNLYYIIATGTIAFDTLFFVSGLFSSHHFFYLKSRYSVEELVSFGGSCGQFMQFVCFVTNRVIRLVPPYAYTVLLGGVAARASRRSSPLALPDGDHRNCGTYWWRNILYVTNMYPADEQCLQVSWYLSTETALHAAGALASAAAAAGAARARLVLAAATALALTAAVTDLSRAYVEDGMQYSNTYSAYSVIVERSWARVPPYFAGVLVGWLVHAVHGRMKLAKMTMSLLWVTSLLLLCSSASLPWVRAPWTAGLHLAWPAALLWPVLACSTYYATTFRRLLGSGGAALSRLSYSMFLLHAVVARYLLMSTGVALCSHTVCIWMYFAGTASVTVVVALLLSLLIEMPCCGLFRRLSDCAAG